MARIFRRQSDQWDELIGIVFHEEREVYAVDDEGTILFLGWVSYSSRRIYDDQRQVIGKVDYDGRIFLHRRHFCDHYVGRVTSQGILKQHLRFRPDPRVGYIREMRSYVEGGAALLFFFYKSAE